MFPLTHLYTAKEILGYETPHSAVGSLFPDFGVIIGHGRNLCHEMSRDLYDFACQHHDKPGMEFATAALTHDIALPGIDWYADEEYHGVRTGFCFQQGQLISERVAKACNLNHSMAVWKAHNVMEMGFDLLTEELHPGCGKVAYKVLSEPHNTDFKLLQAYLNCSCEQLDTMLQTGSRLFSYDGDVEDMATKFIASLKGQNDALACDKSMLMGLIYEAAELIRPCYEDFMAECFEAIKSKLNLMGVIG